MISSLLHRVAFVCLSLGTLISAQSSVASAQSSTASGYVGYNLTHTGDPDSTVYNTSDTSTTTNVTLYKDPDIFLNASVHVGEIDILVANLSAKINLDAQVLQLLKFNAGVDVSIDRVSLTIQEVDAEVLLEARLENLVLMVDDILKSLDLNPVLATLGQDVSSIVNNTVGALTGPAPSSSSGGSGSGVTARSYDLEHNILYSINDYTGNTHTNRILAQNGSIIDQSLDNDGHVHSEKVVGNYANDMTFNGHDKEVTINGQTLRELEYMYMPFPGLDVISLVYMNVAGGVAFTRVLSEISGGGSSTISDEL